MRASVTAAVNAIEPDAPFEASRMEVMLGLAAWAFQAFSVTASLLGAVGLVLAFSGTYGVVAFPVTQRKREFGVRMALGASIRQIVSGIPSYTLRTYLVGTSIVLVATVIAALLPSLRAAQIDPSQALRTE